MLEASLTDRGPHGPRGHSHLRTMPREACHSRKAPEERQDVTQGQGRGHVKPGPSRTAPPQSQDNAPIPAHRQFLELSTRRAQIAKPGKSKFSFPLSYFPGHFCEHHHQND